MTLKELTARVARLEYEFRKVHTAEHDAMWNAIVGGGSKVRRKQFQPQGDPIPSPFPSPIPSEIPSPISNKSKAKPKHWVQSKRKK